MPGQLEPCIHHRIRIQRYRLDPLIHQPLRQVRVIARTLAADADVLAFAPCCLDCHRQQFLDGRIAFVKEVGDDAGVAVEAEGELGKVIRPDREAVEDVEELIGEQGVRGSTGSESSILEALKSKVLTRMALT